MEYVYSYEMEEFINVGLIPMLMSGVPSFAISVATYVLTALAFYTIAKRRGLDHAWMAWVPVVDLWLLGSVSDQYRYVVKGEYKSKRKVLLTLQIISAVCVLVMCCIGIAIAGSAITGAMQNVSESEMLDRVLGPAIGVLGVCVPLLGIGIAKTIIRYMAMYDVYTSLDPKNNVMFLVLSILFPVTEPFFLFFNRNRDDGMPPRKQQYGQPVYEQPVQEPWNFSE